MPASAIATKRAKLDFLKGIHDEGDTYKMALFTSLAGLDADATTYSSTNEVPNGSGYTTGGKALTGVGYATDGSGRAVMSADDVVWTSATISAVGAVIYNDTKAGKPIVSIINFDATVASTSASFTVPVSGAYVARIA